MDGQDTLNDYRVPHLEDLINEVINPIPNKSQEWTVCYLLFHAVIYYFEYAVGAVHSQERGALDHQPDGLLVGDGIDAYVHMATCLVLFERALTHLRVASNRSFQDSDELKSLQSNYKDWKQIIRNKRNRFVHPEEDMTKGPDARFYIMQKRSWTTWHDNGAFDAGLRQVSIQEPTKSELIELTPRKDLERLREYLSEAPKAMRTEIERVASSNS